ncbi:MAG TPA: hypothetical protein VFR23_17885 [Jiangellaceae bacterium]|nr:hypothetical protein [Jiangellaceae bacterium]
MSDERLCVCCAVYRPADEPTLPDDPPVCGSCRKRSRGELSEIPDLYALLPEALEPGRGASEKVSGSRTPPLPVRLEALNLLVAGSVRPIHDKYGDQIGAQPPLVILDSWARDWLSYPWCRGDLLPELTISALTNWLLLRLDDALDNHKAIDDFAFEIHQTLRTLRGVTGSHHTGEHVGLCPMKLRDESRCATKLTVDPYLTDCIRCKTCGTEWNRRKGEWWHLRAQQDGWNEEAA